MKPKPLAFSLLGVLGIFCNQTIEAASPLVAEPLFVRAVSVNGEVFLGELQIAAGQKLKTGDKVITKKGSAKLLYPDRSLVDVGANTSFQIKELEGKDKANSQLDFGMVRALVKKKLDGNKTFTIRTGTSVLAVRGTEFAVEVQPLPNGQFKESVTVGDGRVDVLPPVAGATPIVSIEAGQQFQNTQKVGEIRSPSSVGQGQVVTLKEGEIKKQIDSFKVADQTFQHVVNVGPSGGEPGGAGSVTLASLATEFKPPPLVKSGELDKAAEGIKPPPPPRPPEPSPIQQLNPEISDQLPVRLKVKITL